MKISYISMSIIMLFVSFVSAQEIAGELKKWHKITLTFEGPNTTETSEPNPFTDYRLDVEFNHSDSGTRYIVPGYYAADGKAANTSAKSGNKWRVHFAPDQIGTWSYKASFTTGKHVSISDVKGVSAGYFDDKQGIFEIQVTDKAGRDLRARGRLDYVGKRYLKFVETGEYFLKEGPDAPENMLAYADFDGDFKTDGRKDELIKTWQPHVKHWTAGDPVWEDDKGKGIIGAVNYLSSKGLNSFSFITMNINGDDRNVFPYLDYDERYRIDCSRMDQWEILFEYATQKGMFLHFKTMETENELLLDNGDLGPERKLYYRELIARFGHHLALNWNLGEEINNSTTAQKKSWAQYFYDNDPYHHHIVIHNMNDPHYDLLGPGSKLTGFSLQTDRQDFARVHERVLDYINRSDAAGKPWAVACDEPGDAEHALRPDNDAGRSHEDARKNALWGTLLAGGWGCEWYFGYKHAHSDLTCQDYSSRDSFWDYCKIALDLFVENNIPFWEMENADGLIDGGNGYVFAKEGKIYLVYQKSGKEIVLNFGEGEFRCSLFNPRTGNMVEDNIKIDGPQKKMITLPDREDWLLVIRTDGGTLTSQ